MSYLKGIAVGKKRPDNKRSIYIGVDDTSIPDGHHLSELDIDSVIEIIADLNNLINSNNPSDYLDWGVDLFLVSSYPTISTCVNDLQGVDLGSFPTTSLLNLMIQIKQFKETYQIVSNLNAIVGDAFTSIKNNPQNYIRYEDTNFYWIDINDVKITLTLLPDDFNLSETQYVSQLEPNF